MTEQEMRELFREMREEPVPADSLARVRMGVDARIGRRNWKIAAVLALAGCVLGAFLLLRPAKPVQQVSVPEVAQVSLPVETPVPVAPRPKRVRRPQRVQAVPMLIRIETPDPDVVILLVN